MSKSLVKVWSISGDLPGQRRQFSGELYVVPNGPAIAAVMFHRGEPAQSERERNFDVPENLVCESTIFPKCVRTLRSGAKKNATSKPRQGRRTAGRQLPSACAKFKQSCKTNLSLDCFKHRFKC